MRQFVTQPNSQKRSQRAGENGGHRKSAVAPKNGKIAAKDGANKQAEENKGFCWVHSGFILA